jgi:hypothetical protein
VKEREREGEAGPRGETDRAGSWAARAASSGLRARGLGRKRARERERRAGGLLGYTS